MRLTTTISFLSLLVFLSCSRYSNQAVYPAPTPGCNEVPRRYGRSLSSLRFSLMSCLSQDAVVHPCDQGITDQTPLELDYFSQALQIDPFNSDQVSKQFSICVKFETADGAGDKFSSLGEDVLLNIFSYLSLKERVLFRTINRRTFIVHIVATRRDLINNLNPEITTGFARLNNCTLSAMYFSNLLEPLISVLRIYRHTPENVKSLFILGEEVAENFSFIDFPKNFKDMNNFENLIYTTLAFYRRYNTDTFLELFENACKARFFLDNEFLSDFHITTEELVRLALETDKVTTLKLILKNYIPSYNEVLSGLNVCLFYRSFKSFKVLVKTISKNKEKYMRKVDGIMAIFIKIISMDLIEFGKYLCDCLDMAAIIDSSAIFTSINNRNSSFLSLILRNLKTSVSDVLFASASSVVEYAIASDFPAGIEIIHQLFNDKYRFFDSNKLIMVAIRKHRYDCLHKILELTTNFGTNPLEQLYSRIDLSEIVTCAISCNDSSSLNLILSVVSSVVSINDFFVILPHEHEDFEIYNSSGLYQYVIYKDAFDAFEVLLEKFGSESLLSVDRLGRTPYMHAVYLANEDFVLRIVVKCPESVSIRDMSGNCATHLALFFKMPLSLFTLLNQFELLDWTIENQQKLKPIDLFLDLCWKENANTNVNYLRGLKNLIPSQLLAAHELPLFLLQSPQVPKFLFCRDKYIK